MNTEATIKRNRSLVADTAWVLEVVHRVAGGRLELTATPKGVRALLMHDHEGPAPVGQGRNATEAVHALREAIEAMTET